MQQNGKMRMSDSPTLDVPTPTSYRILLATILIYEINSLPATCPDDNIIILRSISNRGVYRNLQHLQDF